MKKFIALSVFSFSVLLVLGFNSSPTKATSTHIVISEVQIAGAGGVNNDFIELYNPTDTSYDLNGHRLVKRTATGVTDASIKSWSTETIIPAHGYYLWANSSWTPAITPDTTTSQTLAIDNGIALRQGAENTGTIIDSVAWGGATNAFIETSVFPTNPTADQSLERKPGESNPTEGNGDDTDNNANDFALRSVSEPQNSLSTVEPTLATPPPSPTNVPSPIVNPSTLPTPIASPLPTLSPTPTPSASLQPTPSSTPFPSVSPLPTPHSSPTPSVSPQPTIQPSPFPTSSPASSTSPIMRGPHFACTLYWKEFKTHWFRFALPRLSCTKI